MGKCTTMTIKAQDFLDIAVLLAGSEAWDVSRAYCRRAVSLHNLEEEKTMDLELYDELQAIFKATLGDPLPKMIARVCMVCHMILYPGETDPGLKEHYTCVNLPVAAEIDPVWVKNIEGWVE